MTYLLGGNCAAATGVDTEHDGLDVVVIRQLAQVFCGALAHDAMLRVVDHIVGCSVDDAAVGIVDGNFVALFRLLRLHINHVGER